MALRAGAVLQDMEFVQFHPTALYLPSSPPFLLSEAMRGEGAQLRNNKGALFMQQYHPMGALAPRDIVSRAILAEMAATKARHVYLDVTHLGGRVREAAFPDDLCDLPSLRHRYHGRVDPCVSQRALYDGRGLDRPEWCDDSSRVSLPPGRWPVAVCMERIAWRAIPCSKDWCLVRARHRQPWRLPADTSLPALSSQRGHAPSGPIRHTGGCGKIAKLTQANDVGTGRGHSFGRVTHPGLCATVTVGPTRDPAVCNRAALEVKNMVQVAQCVAEAALWRENSVGAHYRSDFPEAKRAGWQQHSRLSSGEVVSGKTTQKIAGVAVVSAGPYRLTGRSVMTPSRTRNVR